MELSGSIYRISNLDIKRVKGGMIFRIQLKETSQI